MKTYKNINKILAVLILLTIIIPMFTNFIFAEIISGRLIDTTDSSKNVAQLITSDTIFDTKYNVYSEDARGVEYIDYSQNPKKDYLGIYKTAGMSTAYTMRGNADASTVQTFTFNNEIYAQYTNTLKDIDGNSYNCKMNINKTELKLNDGIANNSSWSSKVHLYGTNNTGFSGPGIFAERTQNIQEINCDLTYEFYNTDGTSIASPISGILMLGDIDNWRKYVYKKF